MYFAYVIHNPLDTIVIVIDFSTFRVGLDNVSEPRCQGYDLMAFDLIVNVIGFVILANMRFIPLG